MTKFTDDDVYRELFDAKKVIYNEQHNIVINGFEVEIYVQDINQPVISLGEYSVMNDKWIKLPRKRRAHLDQAATKAKFDKLYKLSEYAVRSKNLGKIEAVLKIIKKYRQAGLDLHGEFGPENLAYKAIRSKGVIKHLYNVVDELHSQKLSIPENKLSAQLDEIIDMPPIKKQIDIDAMFNNLQYKIRYHEASELTSIKFPMKNRVFRDGDYGLKFFLFNKDKPVFYLSISKFHDGYKTSAVASNPEVQGQGLGWKLYKAVIDYVDVPLYSDSTQTPDSKNGIWQKLIQNYPKQVVGYNQILRKNIPINNIYQTLPQDQLKDVTDDSRRNTLLLKLLPNAVTGMYEASGYIPSESEKNDPRWERALSVDVHPNTMKQQAKKFGWKISRAGIPPLLRK
jgi:GNAT superfamily N-acetyltransferase